MPRASAITLLAVLSLAALPRLAQAQSRFEIAGGYAAARDPRDEVTLQPGWIAAAALQLTPAVAAVAEASGQYAHLPLLDADVRLSVHTAMGGVRARARIGALTEFAQLLAGVTRAGGSAFGVTSANSSFSLQPGGGVDYPLAAAWAVRAQFDIRLIASQADTTNGGSQYRAAASLVYRVHHR